MKEIKKTNTSKKGKDTQQKLKVTKKNVVDNREKSKKEENIKQKGLVPKANVIKPSTIDNLFTKLKKTKKVATKQNVPVKKSSQQEKPRQNKQTEEGFKIYSLEELKVGKGGGTDLCPFDCDCCF